MEEESIHTCGRVAFSHLLVLFSPIWLFPWGRGFTLNSVPIASFVVDTVKVVEAVHVARE